MMRSCLWASDRKLVSRLPRGTLLVVDMRRLALRCRGRLQRRRADRSRLLDAPKPLDAPAHPGAGPGGGILSELPFAICRRHPARDVDDTADYPTAVVDPDLGRCRRADAAAAVRGDDRRLPCSRRPMARQAPQLDRYLRRAHGVSANFVYPTMGNHECTGYTDSNCGPGGKMASPRTTPSSSRDDHADRRAAPVLHRAVRRARRQWTAKFVFIAANAWDASSRALGSTRR